jgi:N-acetylglucosaminyldiphosphoundecaprenol N-acetyl-beta-D-mannosaminyltransferase
VADRTTPNPPSRGALPSFDVLGTGVSITTPAGAVQALLAWSDDDCGRYVCIRDAHGVMLARRDIQLAAIHREAAMVTPDGMPLALLGKLRGLPVRRTCGPDLMLDMFAASRDGAVAHYLYGGREGIARELAARLRARFPGVSIRGEETPPFRPIDDRELRELAGRIAASGAAIVWIGLSTPKQEKLMHRLAPLVGATLIGVGAAFDLHAGYMERAPRWMQKICLEGAYRLFKEPRRLWRRYLLLAPQFLVLALAQHARLALASQRAGPGNVRRKK